MIVEVDERAWNAGRIVIGVDEVGRGPIAGPIAAGAVVMAGPPVVEGIKDSKQLSEKRREVLAPLIEEECFCSVAYRSNKDIDEHGLTPMLFWCMREAVQAAAKAYIDELQPIEDPPFIVFVDGAEMIPDLKLPQRTIVKGDMLSKVVGAASIVAKVFRDRMMIEYAKRWPQYGFEKHKGYGTPQHIQAVLADGACSIHRKSVRTLHKHERNQEWEEAKKRGAGWHELQLLGGYRS